MLIYEDVCWSDLLAGSGTITGTTSFDIDDVCWSRMFKPDSSGGGGDVKTESLVGTAIVGKAIVGSDESADVVGTAIVGQSTAY